MLVLNLPFKALMFLTLMRPSLVLFLVLWLKLVKDFLKVRCRLALLPFLIDRKSGSAGMPRPISYAVFCLKKKTAWVCCGAVHHCLRCDGVQQCALQRNVYDQCDGVDRNQVY